MDNEILKKIKKIISEPIIITRPIKKYVLPKYGKIAISSNGSQ